LSAAGQYATVTYRHFVLELGEEWHQQVYPESLRLFLRQLRHHLEQ
jgi:hypothetical protein